MSLLPLLGLELTPNNHREKLVSALGGFAGIALTLLISTLFLGPTPAMLLVASMGASCVLLFAQPHGPLSQPWPFFAGHLLSALSGVICQKLLPGLPVLAAPASVGLAIAAMYYARCIHPPGGATALTVVLAGPAVHALGFCYVLTPVALNCAALLAIAIAFNYPFPWRRYPAALVRRPAASRSATALSHEHLSYALKHMSSLVDVSEEDLAEIYSLALHHAHGTHLSPDQIRPGRSYANSPSSPHYAIRHVVDTFPADTPGEEMVLFWTLAGHHPHRASILSRSAFALWACQELPEPVTARPAPHPVSEAA